jgi:hypothetical protein
MAKLWLIYRELDYYTYYAFLVRAESQEQAWEVLRRDIHKEANSPEEAIAELPDNPWNIKAVDGDGPSELVFASYSSG